MIHNRWKDACSADGKPETSILFDEQGPQTFGSQAKQTYINLQNADKWMLFEKYKMSLYVEPTWKSKISSTRHMAKEGSDIKPYVYADGDSNKKQPTETVFVAQLKHLKKEADAFMKAELHKKRKLKFKAHQVQWILTVPAIWSDKAKAKMKKWAKLAGIDALKIVYEPDCAALSI